MNFDLKELNQLIMWNYLFTLKVHIVVFGNSSNLKVDSVHFENSSACTKVSWAYFGNSSIIVASCDIWNSSFAKVMWHNFRNSSHSKLPEV